MTIRPAVVLLALQLGAVPAFAQRDGGFQRWPSRGREAAPAPQGEQGTRTRERQEPQARQRQEPQARERQEPQARRAEPATRQPDARREGSGGGDRRNNVAVQRDRDGDQRREAQLGRDRNAPSPRVAVPRQGPPPRTIVRPSRPNVYIVRPPAYRYTPRFSRPYVYGALGPGYFYYGSYGWYPRATYFDDRGYFGRGYGYDVGEVRLRVEPRWAEVWVDGYFAGTVDDFDGTFQSLRLESGPYHVEIVAPGYETLEVDLRVSPGQKITYRGELRREF